MGGCFSSPKEMSICENIKNVLKRPIYSFSPTHVIESLQTILMKSNET